MRDLRALVLAATATTSLLCAQSNLQFTAAPIPNVPVPIAVDSIFGDCDADGDLDFVLVAATGPRIYRNDGSGVFTDQTALFPPFAPNMRTAAFVDVDGDQRREVLLTWDGLLRLFRLLPDGTWQELANAFPPALPTVHGAVAVDVDNDGDEDLACAGHWLGGGANQLLTNDGTGVFTATQPFPGTAFQVLAIDAEQDGDMDLFTARGGFSLWRNDGGGTFTDVSAAQLPTGIGMPNSMDSGDVDGDGLVDLVLGNTSLGDLLLVNLGGGIFGRRTLTVPQPSAFTQTVALADVDGDGQLDWPRGTINYGQPTLWLGAGFGRFVDASFRMPVVPSIACQLRARDLDGDGDPDLVLTGLSTPPQVFWNRHRHVAITQQPTLGGAIAFELASQPGYGTSGRAGLVGLSLGRFDPLIPVPPFGMLGLDTSQIAMLGFATYLDFEGVSAFSVAVPSQPQFLGLPLYVQGFVDDAPGGTPRFTALWGTEVR